jgi:hypothetical protein
MSGLNESDFLENPDLVVKILRANEGMDIEALRCVCVCVCDPLLTRFFTYLSEWLSQRFEFGIEMVSSACVLAFCSLG